VHLILVNRDGVGEVPVWSDVAEPVPVAGILPHETQNKIVVRRTSLGIIQERNLTLRFGRDARSFKLSFSSQLLPIALPISITPGISVPHQLILQSAYPSLDIFVGEF
jgi:hypothetical protein